eukprot:COSAG02_NODE_4483_length_5304_cov_2.651297_9_plen_109_part_01
MLHCFTSNTLTACVQALEKDDKALLVNVDKMAYANLYVTDGDLHVQAVDTLPTPNPRGVFDSQRTNMVGNARAVPYVDEIVAMALAAADTFSLALVSPCSIAPLLLIAH